MIALAFYKGPPRNDWRHTVSHYGIRLWTWSRWSHGELVIDGVCYSSSSRDGGVRSKVIDLNSGRWDVVQICLPDSQKEEALEWFRKHDGVRYGWGDIFKRVLSFLPGDKKGRVCFEAIGEALGFAGAHRLDADDLYEWAQKRLKSTHENT